jgi:hypothetical protein
MANEFDQEAEMASLDFDTLSEEDTTLIKQQENKWHYINDLNCEILSHTFNDNKFFFKVKDGNFNEGYTGVICYSDLQSIRYDDEPFVLPGDDFLTDEAKKMVENTIEHFKGNEKITVDYINNHLKAQIDQMAQQQESQNKLNQEETASINTDNQEFNWHDIESISVLIDFTYGLKGEYLMTSFDSSDSVAFVDPACFFVAKHTDDHIPKNYVEISYFNKAFKNELTFSFEFKADSEIAKKLVENTVVHFAELTIKDFSTDDIKNYLNTQIKQLEPQQPVQQPPVPDRQSEFSYLSLSEEDKKKMFSHSHFFIFEYQKEGENFVDYDQFAGGEAIDYKSLESKYGASFKISGPFFEPSDVHYRVLEIEEEIEKNKFVKKSDAELSSINKQTQNQQQESQQQTQHQPSVPDRQLETAQKTGYVQGVCESVLAFNNEDNRKIMTDSTMNFLSKKLLSEMNVTKDMAQKFAHPETYKALEQCVFSSKQEQHLEQTQSRGR